jgi:hypothetical protein
MFCQKDLAMTSLTLSRPTVWRRFEDFWKTMAPSRDCATPRGDSQEDSRAERDFILEMLDRNPDVFQSESDIHSMARLYRCKF